MLHTHETARSSGDNGDASDCYQESVSRTRRNDFWNGCVTTNNSLKCEINGDALCDTEASPGSLSAELSSCNYIGNEEDNWGDTFTPPTNNYMSYTSNFCRNELTPNQISSMHQHIIYYMADGGFPLPGFNGEPRYNKNIISLEGASNFDDVENYISPEFIQVSNYTASNGSKVTLIAQEEVKISAGVHLKPGTNFQIKVEEITSCNSVTTASKSSVVSKFVSKSEENDIESKIIELYLKSKIEKENIVSKVNANSLVIAVYPNPTNDSFTISSDETITNYSVFNSLSTMVLNKEVHTNKVAVDIQNLSEGMYTVRVVLVSREVKWL